MIETDRPTLFVLMGIPGSGKSTWVMDRVYVDSWDDDTEIVCPDTIRAFLTGDASDMSRDAEVWEKAYGMARDALSGMKDVIFDATGVRTLTRLELLALADECRANKVLVVFKTPFAVCQERNASRERVVPDDVIVRMYRQFEASLLDIAREDWDRIEFVRET